MGTLGDFFFVIYLCIYQAPLHKLDNKSHFKAEFNRFELRVFLLLDWLPYQG